jgi:hypothetical protein
MVGKLVVKQNSDFFFFFTFLIFFFISRDGRLAVGSTNNLNSATLVSNIALSGMFKK